MIDERYGHLAPDDVERTVAALDAFEARERAERDESVSNA